MNRNFKPTPTDGVDTDTSRVQQQTENLIAELFLTLDTAENKCVPPNSSNLHQLFTK
jgi:hypothetical protein